jgi:mannitol/fructose-specific phosphotransferase system IIA component
MLTETNWRKFPVRYLYRYLKTISATDEEKMKVLEDLLKLDRTSEYVDDLVKLKSKSGL